jgi:hypothetical protein
VFEASITGKHQLVKRGFREVFGHYEKIKQGKTCMVALGASGPGYLLSE